MLDLLFGVPPHVWALLALIVLVPLAVGTIGLAIARRRTVGIATRLASRAAVIMGLGFGVLAIVATLAVLHTGFREIRRRYLPEVVALSSALGTSHAEQPGSVSIEQELALFRAGEPEAGPLVAWADTCGTRCLAVVSESGTLDAVQRWARRMVAHPPAPGTFPTVTVGGELHLVIAGALRNPVGAPTGHLLVAVRAGWVAQQALRTAAILVVLAYVLLLSVWWVTHRMIAASVATRVKKIAARLRAAEGRHAPDVPEPGVRDELALLERNVHRHIVESVEQLREADRRAIEARSQAARMEATATLAAGVAHDFNNLMTGVMANGYLLRQDFADDPETQSIVSTIIECAARGGRLAQQLLAFARGGKYTPTVADLNAIIRESERLEAHAVGDGIELHLDLAEDLHAIEADPVQISQVVSNLLRNAIEAMRAGGRVTISTDNVVLDGNRPAPLADLSDGPYVILTVSDTGTGMSADTVARVFEPFFTTKEGGRGMGLAATYGIVTHHGGKIDVRSQPGSGTAFTVYLPALPAERRATRPAPAPAPARAGTRPSRGTVLFVDDEVAILSPTGRLLEAKGFRVLAAESGPEAIAIARAAATPIDIILLDMRMPGMSGAEAFDPLRAAQPGAQVFVCSGYELDSAARSLFERGAVGFIRKPFTIDELVRTIESPPRQSTGGAEP